MDLTKTAKRNVIASALFVALAASSSGASATTITSESFELPALPVPPAIQYGPDTFAFNTGVIGPVAIADFTFSGFSGIIANGSLGVFPDTAFGTQAAFLQSYQSVGSDIQWTVFGLTLGASYELSFWDVGSLVVPTEPFRVAVCGGSPVAYAPTSTYTVETQNFTATATSCVVDFASSVLASNQASAIDNLTISTVPEPLSLSLFGTGLVAAVAVRRRRKKKAA